MQLEFTRIKNDVNGNPRYVVHFYALDVHGWTSSLDVSERYAIACKLANKIGGRKHHTKRYGGGIVFQSYSITETMNAINRIAGKKYEEAVVS
jgi:hypothetical protein